MKNITIEFEGRDEGAAFFALYAGLKMYSDLKAKQKKGTNEVSIAGAEAYSILEDIKESHPKECAEAKKEYESTVENLGIFDVRQQREPLKPITKPPYNCPSTEECNYPNCKCEWRL